MSEKIYYTKEHEWVRVEGNVATIGITNYAQSQLGDVVFVELPEAGRVLKAHEAAAVVESVKAASEVYAPVSGKVTQANEALVEHFSLINEAPESDGWFFKLELANAGELDGLMDRAAYDAFVKEHA